jgi:hypothetical protein
LILPVRLYPSVQSTTTHHAFQAAFGRFFHEVMPLAYNPGGVYREHMDGLRNLDAGDEARMAS